MELGMVNKLTIVNRFVVHTLHRNITHLAVITHKTTGKRGNLWFGGNEKALLICIQYYLEVHNFLA